MTTKFTSESHENKSNENMYNVFFCSERSHAKCLEVMTDNADVLDFRCTDCITKNVFIKSIVIVLVTYI